VFTAFAAESMRGAERVYWHWRTAETQASLHPNTEEMMKAHCARTAAEHLFSITVQDFHWNYHITHDTLASI